MWLATLECACRQLYEWPNFDGANNWLNLPQSMRCPAILLTIDVAAHVWKIWKQFLKNQNKNFHFLATFHWAGQNLAMLWTSFTETSPSFNINTFLMDRVTSWFSENIYTRVSDIGNFTTLNNGNNAIGHFTGKFAFNLKSYIIN